MEASSGSDREVNNLILHYFGLSLKHAIHLEMAQQPSLEEPFENARSI